MCSPYKQVQKNVFNHLKIHISRLLYIYNMDELQRKILLTDGGRTIKKKKKFIREKEYCSYIILLLNVCGECIYLINLIIN